MCAQLKEGSDAAARVHAGNPVLCNTMQTNMLTSTAANIAQTRTRVEEVVGATAVKGMPEEVEQDCLAACLHAAKHRAHVCTHLFWEDYDDSG